MASFLNADLPSSDEEDNDYRPDLDKTADAEDRVQFVKGGQTVNIKRRRHGRAAAADIEDQREEVEEELPAEAEEEGTGPQVMTSRQIAKRAKIDHLWLLLNSKPGHPRPAPSPDVQGSPATASPQMAPGHKGKASTLAHGPGSAISLAALCKSVDPKQRKVDNTDMLWMRSLGMAPPASRAAASPSTSVILQLPGAASAVGKAATAAPVDPSQVQQQGQGAATGDALPMQIDASVTGVTVPTPDAVAGPSRPQISEAAKAAAGAALAAARDALSLKKHGRVNVTETRRFAGKDIQVTTTVDQHSKDAQRAAERPLQPPAKSGLDAFLADLEKKKKVNVLDKTKADWQQLKAGDSTLEEEMEAHKRSGAGYLDKVDFLKRTETREYEQERDKRLASDIRTRGRL